MWNGKNKAVTFSFDDGVTQDRRLVEIFNKYGLKCTFNLNSELFDKKDSYVWNGIPTRHDKISANEVKALYEGHEVAAHTLTHPNLTTLDEQEIIYQVERDRENLSALCGYEVVGMAYPCGGVNNDERVAKIIRENTGIKYARTITFTQQFDLSEDLYRFNPSIHYIDEGLDALVDKFLALQTDKPQLLYIMGHAYEMDAKFITWEHFEEICTKLSGHSDIFYGTNKEIIL